VVAARGGSAESAEKWIERKIGAATGPVRNEVAFIRGCLAREPAATGQAKKPPTTKAGKGKTTAGGAGGNGRYDAKAKAAAVERVRAGELVAEVARDLGAAPSTVTVWVEKDRWAREFAATKCDQCSKGGAQRLAGGRTLCPACERRAVVPR